MKQIAYAICVVGLCAVAAYAERTDGDWFIWTFLAFWTWIRTDFVNARITLEDGALSKQRIEIDGRVFYLVEAHIARAEWMDGEKARLTLRRETKP